MHSFLLDLVASRKAFPIAKELKGNKLVNRSTICLIMG
jgi:hypothetical protein